jgi:hypothetical protein
MEITDSVSKFREKMLANSKQAREEMREAGIPDELAEKIIGRGTDMLTAVSSAVEMLSAIFKPRDMTPVEIEGMTTAMLAMGFSSLARLPPGASRLLVLHTVESIVKAAE